jgi:hypothetical protein
VRAWLRGCVRETKNCPLSLPLARHGAPRRKPSHGKAANPNRLTPGQQAAAESRVTFDRNCHELDDLYESPDELRSFVGARVSDSSNVSAMVAEVQNAAKYVVTEMTAGTGGDAFLGELGVRLVVRLKNAMGTPKKPLGGSAKRGARPSGRELDELKLRLIIAHYLLRDMPGGLDGAHVLLNT